METSKLMYNLELGLDFRHNIGCKVYYFMALEYNPNNMFEIEGLLDFNIVILWSACITGLPIHIH